MAESGVDVAEVQAVRQQHEVGGEAVAADVRALPDLVGPLRLAQAAHDGRPNVAQHASWRPFVQTST